MPAHFNGWICSQHNPCRRAYKCRATYNQWNLNFSSFLVSGSSLQIPISAFLNNSLWPLLSDSMNMRYAPSSKIMPPTNAHTTTWVGCWEPLLSRGRNRRELWMIYFIMWMWTSIRWICVHTRNERESTPTHAVVPNMNDKATQNKISQAKSGFKHEYWWCTLSWISLCPSFPVVMTFLTPPYTTSWGCTFVGFTT